MAKVSHGSETPAHGEQVITVCAFIHQKVGGVEKLFSAKRAATKKFLPGVWELPGGHINFGEDLTEGLKREIFEETGMTIDVGDPFSAFSYVNPIKGSHSVQITYFATFTTPSANITLNPADHSEWGWFGENGHEIVSMVTKPKNDPEFQTVKKGFSLLHGGHLRF